MEITEAQSGLAAAWNPMTLGLTSRKATIDKWGAALPGRPLRVKGFFAAVPQIEHNSTPHRASTPQT
jgi:hypothetical protein